MFDPELRPLETFRDLSVTVMGLGLFGGGKGATEFLAREGARVTVTDTRPPEVLEPVVAQLRHLPIRWVLGRHDEEDFLEADLVVPSPAVPRSSPLLRRCVERGVRLDTEMNLFFKYCAGRICAVTGSNGKTTTTSLLGTMAAARWPGVRVGGNLGKSLLPDVRRISPNDWVILELSSFQLEDLRSIPRRPQVAVVTNLSPNHLDRHGTYEAYLAAKRVIVENGPVPNTAVLNGEDPLTRAWGDCGRRVLYFGRSGATLPRVPGVWLLEDEGRVLLSRDGKTTALFDVEDVPLRGRFNTLNAAAAAAAATAMGVPSGALREAVRGFRPVEHRLELVRIHEGVEYYNDSIATTPESTIVALRALGPNAVFICGGASKGASFQALGQALSWHCRAVVLIGKTADAIAACIHPREDGPRVLREASLEAAVEAARSLARAGDRVVLSPACASFDMFLNFVERGERFKAAVHRLPSP